MDLQPETILHERYQIIKKLGQGGMGAVYLAWDETLETQVAVKSNFNPAPESVDQFLREAQLLAALRHQNLPRVTDYFVIGEEQFLVMDFIPGDDLGKKLKEEGWQKLDNVLRWVSQLSSALAYMHGQDPPVTHRDIKPANIKLTAEGDAILVDFGIAKVASVQSQTATGASGYTPGYAPPEQYGQGRTGPYSDQFSLAATVYALLTAKKPADSIQRVMGKASLTPAKVINPAVPQNVSDALLKAMSLQPGERFTSIDAFQAALEDPEFRLDDQAREQITSAPAQEPAGKTRIAGQTEQATVVGSAQRKKRTRNIIIGVVAGLGAISVCVVIALLLLLPGSPLCVIKPRVSTSIEAAAISPTDTETLRPTDTSAPLITAPSDTPLPEPSATTTPTPTATPELVGESGVIAFASDRGPDGIVQIWTMHVLSAQDGQVYADLYTQLTFDEGDKDQPVWSPDGSQIAYVAPGGEGKGLDIWIMDADGRNQRDITNHAGDEFDPVWMPDGSMIAFTHHLRDEGDAPIYALTLISPDGTQRERLSVDFVEWDPAFSPDGSWLLYVISAKSHDYFYFRGSFDGFASPRGFDLRAIFGEFGEVSDPAWAPVGSQFAYTEHIGSGENIVLVTYNEIQVNGVHLPTEYILTDTNAETDAAWSPDGHWLAFTSTRDDGDSEVYLMTTTGRPQINLTMHQGIDRSPDWKPVSIND
jgi:serine/threonine protein kinase/Tol biopolymer transport system component